jgi:uncharacterized protein (DUF2147 family)
MFSFNVKAEKSEDILGQWYSENNESLIEIYQKNNKFYGKLIWLKEPNRNGKPKMDDKNPDTKLQSRPLLDLVILKDFTFNGSDEWEDGKIYDPKSGKTYDCFMKLDNKNKLKIRGYIGISLIGRTSYWTRKKE